MINDDDAYDWLAKLRCLIFLHTPRVYWKDQSEGSMYYWQCLHCKKIIGGSILKNYYIHNSNYGENNYGLSVNEIKRRLADLTVYPKRQNVFDMAKQASRILEKATQRLGSEETAIIWFNHVNTESGYSPRQLLERGQGDSVEKGTCDDLLPETVMDVNTVMQIPHKATILSGKIECDKVKIGDRVLIANNGTVIPAVVMTIETFGQIHQHASHGQEVCLAFRPTRALRAIPSSFSFNEGNYTLWKTATTIYR